MEIANTNFNLFEKRIKNPFWIRLFMITKLPSAYFSSVRLQSVNEKDCAVSVQYKWFSTNPFKSIYFACLAMAAEMSTGVLALGHTYKNNPHVSMLVSKVEANFIKKAVGKIVFTCEDGLQIRDVVRAAVLNEKTTFISTNAVGKNEMGEIVATFIITWAFKAKIA
jgi:Domain of unknown function (DUF4442)